MTISLATILMVAAGLAADGSDAEPRAEPHVEEHVVVTGAFRDTVARKLPASVVVLDEREVRGTSSTHFETLAELVPNVNHSGEGNRAQYWQVRGIGEREEYTGAPDPSVGFVIDDVDLSGIGGVATLWDVDRVEVLRGPQGTRFGASALAGAITMRSAAPPEAFELEGELRAGGDDEIGLGLAIGGPLDREGRWSGRLSAYRLDGDGHRDNAFLGRDDTNGRRETTVRGKLRWQPDAPWTVDLTGFVIDADDGYDAFAIDNGLTTQSDRPGRDAQRTVAGSLRATGRGAERFTVVAISSAASSDGTFSFDADWGNAGFWAPYTYDFFSETRRSRRTLTQELRLVSTPGGRLGWVAGVYGARLTESNRTVDDGTYVDPAFPDDPFLLDASIRREYEADTLALFGEATLALGRRDTLALGLRGERRAADYRDDTGNAFDPDETMLGGQLTWSRELGPARTVYARIARGYKAGGFNLDLPAAATDEQRLYDAEYLWNYEAGLKGRRRDGRAAWELVGFWSDRRDQQVATSTQLDPSNPTTFVFLTDNAGSGTNAGVEAGGSWQAAPAWRLRGQLGWLETEIDRFGANEALTGRDQAHAPRLSYALGADWRGAAGGFARVDVVGRSAFYFDTSHDRRSEPSTLVHARVGLDRGAWTAFVWGRNLLDETWSTRGFFFGNEPPDFPDTLYVKRGDPRQVGLGLRFVR